MQEKFGLLVVPHALPVNVMRYWYAAYVCPSAGSQAICRPVHSRTAYSAVVIVTVSCEVSFSAFHVLPWQVL
jgi:hypothetical protein